MTIFKRCHNPFMSIGLVEKLISLYDVKLKELFECKDLLKEFTFQRYGQFENFNGLEIEELIFALGGSKDNYDLYIDVKDRNYIALIPLYSKKKESIKLFKEEEFFRFIIKLQNIYQAKIIKKDWEWSSKNPPAPTLLPSRYFPGGGIYGQYSHQEELYKQNATFYIIKIKVPMKNGSECLIHKPGVCNGNVIGRRYRKDDPVSVCIEIKNINRYLAENLEIKLLLIMKKVPWEKNQYGRPWGIPENPEERGVLTNNYQELRDRWKREWARNQLLKNKTMWEFDNSDKNNGYKVGFDRKCKELVNSFLESFNSVPNYPKSWEEKLGCTEWRIWEGTDKELKELVEKLIPITWDKPYKVSLSDNEKRYKKIVQGEY